MLPQRQPVEVFSVHFRVVFAPTSDSDHSVL